MLPNKVITTVLICIGCIQIVNAKPAPRHKSENNNCNSIIVSAVGNHLHQNDFSPRNGGGRIIIETCKVWPNNKEITIAAFVSSDSQGHADDLIIAMVNNRTAEVVASYHEALVNSFVPKINANADILRIDTARYDLAPGTRAFGLDVIAGPNRDRRCGEDEMKVVRTLFVREGNIIRPIFLGGLPISYRRFLQNDPKCINTKAASYLSKAIRENIDLTIQISHNFTDDYANLLITAVSSNGRTDKPQRNPLHYELGYKKNIYNGRDIGSYPLPNIEEALDQWQND